MAQLQVATESALIVEGFGRLRDTIAENLEDAGFECVVATTVDQAIYLLAERDFEVLISDVALPGTAGVDLLRIAHQLAPEMPVVMVGSTTDPDSVELALATRCGEFLFSPFEPDALLNAVRGARRRKRQELTEAAERRALRMRGDELTARLEQQEQLTGQAQLDSLRRLQRVLHHRDVETAGHLERVAGYCALMAGQVGLDADLLAEASRVHDVGKVAVPDSILRKPGPLSPSERLGMERHTVIGHQILGGSSVPLIETAATVALTHHERWDGSGYPRGLAEAAIPIEGRVVAIADAFDALTSDRVYRAATDPESALRLLRGERGRQFDPALLDAFLACRAELLEIYAALRGL